MTLDDLAAIVGLAAMVVVYVGLRLGERGGCPNCHGPGACGAREETCDRDAGAGSAAGDRAAEAESDAARDGGRRR